MYGNAGKTGRLRKGLRDKPQHIMYGNYWCFYGFNHPRYDKPQHIMYGNAGPIWCRRANEEINLNI